MFERARTRVASMAATLLLLLLPLAACDRGEQAEAERELDRIGQEADQELEKIGEKAEEAWEEAKPEIEEGMREAGKAVGKGVEAAGEALQRGGQEIQEEARDASESTLPDTVSEDTMILRENR